MKTSVLKPLGGNPFAGGWAGRHSGPSQLPPRAGQVASWPLSEVLTSLATREDTWGCLLQWYGWRRCAGRLAPRLRQLRTQGLAAVPGWILRPWCSWQLVVLWKLEGSLMVRARTICIEPHNKPHSSKQAALLPLPGFSGNTKTCKYNCRILQIT